MSVRDRSFKRRNRLRKKDNFKRVIRKGRKRRGRFLTVYYIGSAETDCRLGVVVGRAVGGAVVRNRVKRLIREIFRHIKSDVLPGTHLVVRANESCRRASFQELRRELTRLVGIE